MSGIDRDTIMAYVDGQLDQPRRDAVEADPAAMAEVAVLQRQSDAIRTLHAPAGAEPVPKRLDPHRLALLRARRRWSGLRQAAVLAVFLGIGIVTGWLNRPAPDEPALYNRLIADAVSAHTVYVAENRHAVEVPGGETEHLSTWLSNRLGTGLAMPDLSPAGLSFLGGRLLPAPAIPGGRAAQLMYEDAAGQRLTLYVTPSNGVDGPELEAVSFGGDNALYWANATITCTIVGSQSPEALQALATSIFAQLTPAASAEVPDYEL
ncbi:transcriptional regulator [Devosia lucknowensis]|uniref:Transcriptional regulator n=1 Tax=Devosia lucknowensis TaxID=1096929 RepID=A0A1Y6FSX0_9HYPH|nr:anti-sigma factor [Devosia lucknowensis]SMQ75962.1 transcriptional regulator [Devosia lucknowensis]